jgi:hypothetical protein
MASGSSLTRFGFGIEIEAVGQPWKVRDEWRNKPQEYYERLAQALRNRGLVAIADRLNSGYQNQHPEHYNKWFITSDGSLQGTGTQGKFFAPSNPFFFCSLHEAHEWM